MINRGVLETRQTCIPVLVVDSAPPKHYTQNSLLASSDVVVIACKLRLYFCVLLYKSCCEGNASGYRRGEAT
jgi:hypothetical protein